MEDKLEPFSLVWLPFGETNKYYLTPDDFEGHLPWFIWGDNHDNFEKNSSFEVSEEYLLKGILYGLSPRTFKVGAFFNKDDLLVILDKLKLGYKYDNDELLILNAAYSMKTINGIMPFLTVLRTGRYLLPESSKIKSDYILGLWERACEDKNDMSIYEEILELIPKIDLTDINSFSKEYVCYYGFCSLLLLKHDTKLKQDVNKYIEQYIYGMITTNEIQLKISDLLDNPDKEFTPKELMVHDE
jgi:hypothetical protein